MSTSNSAAPLTFWSAIGLAAAPLAMLWRIGSHLLRWILVLVRAPRSRPPRWPGGAALGIAVIVVAIVGSMFVVDVPAIEWARGLPPWIVDDADEITNFGLSGYFLYPLGFILLCIAAIWAPSLPRGMQGTLAALAARFGFLFVAIGLPGLFSTIIKRMIGRARPYAGSHDDPFAYMPFIWRAEYASMPSGHATTAAAAAVAIGAVWPRLRGVMWIYALIIMTTRVVIAVHHPSDVLAGALVGAVGALLVRDFFAARHLVFSVSDLQPYSWPSLKRINAVAHRILSP